MNIRPLAALALSVIATSALPAHAAERKCGAGSCSKKTASAPAAGPKVAEASCSRKEASCSKKDAGRDAAATKKEAGCAKKEASCAKKDGAGMPAAAATPAVAK